ncbi:NADP-dependent oxidoreductase [Amycolatopsis acidicola]|uniref:NADP-dependent oxidoreductase n=1 Tax=Amycolatopsis acidicola TaxID=2596893 RepID=A0A5N0UP30_9PSEU|nr:NADP-dependent oxidoreductase [Amycolatopsis acidicola]
MSAVRFHEFGGPEVLVLDEIPVPRPGKGRIRIAVGACGLNPADAGLHAGMFSRELPGGVGLDVSGTVEALGEGVTGVAVGDRVFGPSTASTGEDGITPGAPSGGAADKAVLAEWAKVPEGLDMLQAAALPLAAETAWRALDQLGVARDDLLLVHGAGGAVGFAAVQLALHRGARVIATAGPARAGEIRAMGAEVTSYGEGIAGRVRALAGGPVRHALDISPRGSGSIPVLIELAGSRERVLTLSDFAAAAELGVRASDTSVPTRWDVLDDVARLAVKGLLTIPIGRTFPLAEFREAIELAESGRPGGKVLVLPR